MSNNQVKLNVLSVLTEGINIGVKNAASLIGAIVLWIVTIWIPYINVGTTIAISTIPIELSKGNVISPFFIFGEKYRRYMGEYFALQGMMMMSIIPAMFYMIVPGIIISIGWSLAVYILLDKGVAPGEAMVMSNKATYGNKWAIFFIPLVFCVVAGIAIAIVISLLNAIGLSSITWIFLIALTAVTLAGLYGCYAVIYRELVTNCEETPAEHKLRVDQE